MAEPIDLVQQALNALADAGLGNDSPAEAFVIGLPGRMAGGARPVHTNRNGNQQRTEETNEHHQQ